MNDNMKPCMKLPKNMTALDLEDQDQITKHRDLEDQDHAQV